MTPEAAAWVAAHVLSESDEDRINADYCACRYGVCGHCDLDRHEMCTTPRLEAEHVARGRQMASPAGYVLTRAGRIACLYGVNTQVWRVGQACRWICPCTSCRTADREAGVSYSQLVVAAPGNPLRPGRLVVRRVLVAPVQHVGVERGEQGDLFADLLAGVK